jgi:hypothetical protein
MQATDVEQKVANLSRPCCAELKCNDRMPTKVVLMRLEYLGAMSDKERHRFLYEELKNMVGPPKESGVEFSVWPRWGRTVTVQNSYGQQGDVLFTLL